jgi:hypothetical protein
MPECCGGSATSVTSTRTARRPRHSTGSTARSRAIRKKDGPLSFARIVFRTWRVGARLLSRTTPSILHSWSVIERYEHLLEQRAYCLLRAGEIALAQCEFEALLARWEQNEHLANEAWGRHLEEALRGPLRDALLERTRALVERARRAREKGLFMSPFGGIDLLRIEDAADI